MKRFRPDIRLVEPLLTPVVTCGVTFIFFPQHYELDRENLQLLAMRLSCLSHSLHNELCQSHTESQRLTTQILADIANIVTCVKPLIAWLDR